MDDRLATLIQQAQHWIAQPEQQQPVLGQLVQEILRSRRVGRAVKGEALSGVYREIAERLQRQLEVEVGAAIATCNLQRDSARAWAQALQNQVLRQVLDDALLKQLALEAQRQPPHSPLRHHALTQLVEAIRLSGRLVRPHKGLFPPHLYDLLYEEAVNQTLTYVCRRIDTYDPERGQAQRFLNWVNFRLERTMIDCRREYGDAQVQSLPDLQTLESIPQPEPASSLASELLECIQADAQQVFRTTHIRDRPDANFRAIALARCADRSWEEISAELQIKIPTLSSFFRRCCSQFAPLFQEYI
jgi:hypothetical protein